MSSDNKIDSKVIPLSVNYHFTRVCNYKCGFCFHTQKNTYKLPIEDAIRGLYLLKKAGTKKINFAGGEPFCFPDYLGKLIQECKENIKFDKLSIITNGSLVTKNFFEKYGKYIDIFGVSCDSFNKETNIKIGRGKTGDNVEKLFELRQLCKDYGIKFKLNTVVCKYNKDENMVDYIKKLNPDRWKVFQVLMVKGENDNSDRLRNVTEFQITDEEFNKFIERHKEIEYMVPESNESMKSSYLILDEEMRFLEKGVGEEFCSESILDVGVEKAIQSVVFNEKEFKNRKGDYWMNDFDSAKCGDKDKKYDF